MKKNDLFTRSIILIFVVLFFALSCGENNSDKDALINNNIAKLNALKDSIKTEQLLQESKASIDNIIANVAEIKDSINFLEKNMLEVDDSLNAYTAILTEINIKIDDIQKKKKYVSETNDKNKNKVTTNIADLEAFINSLKISKSNKEGELLLIDKRKDLITKKNDALETELDYKQTELKELYSQQNAQLKIKEVNESIVKISSDLANNNNLLLEEELNQKLLKNKIAALDTEIKANQGQFKIEYEKSTGMDDYVKEEGKALDNQIKKLEILESVNSDKWKNFKEEKERIEAKIERLKIEMSEISLNSDQVNKQENNNVENTNLQSQSKEELNNSSVKNNENSKPANLETELVEQEESSSSFIYWLIIFIVIVVSILYWLGKKNKNKNSN